MTFIRYGFVQLAAYVVDLGGFLALMAIGGIGPLAANAAAKIAAGVFAFASHRVFTFRVGADSGVAGQAVRYFALLAANVPISSAVLYVVLAVIPNSTVAKIVSDVLCIGLTYAVSRHLVFRTVGETKRKAPGP